MKYRGKDKKYRGGAVGQISFFPFRGVKIFGGETTLEL